MPNSIATTPLLSALHRLRMSDTPDATRALEEVTTLLANGADPNEADSRGITPLSFFYTNPRANKAANERESKCWQFKEALRILVGAGADTLRHEAIFYSKSAYAYRIVAGTHIKADAPNAIEAFLACFERLSLDWADNFASSDAVKNPTWTTQARPSDGKNILHLLWGKIVPRENKIFKADYQQQTSNRAWEMTQRFWKMGADMYAPDHAGETPAFLLGNLLDTGMLVPQHKAKEGQLAFEEVMATIEANRLQTTTAGAAPRSRMGRL
jgi:hypothetical protein